MLEVVIGRLGTLFESLQRERSSSSVVPLLLIIP